MDRAHRSETPPTWPPSSGLPFRPMRADAAPDRQLALPLPLATPPGPVARPPPTPVALVRPRRVWGGVPPAARARVRQAAERVLEEVVRDGLHRDGHDRRG